MAVQIQVRRGTAAQWTSANPILAAGEIGAETDTSKFKIGDGVTAWQTLGYALYPSAYTTVNTQTGTTYTFVLADQTRLISFTNASAVTATIPLNSSVAYEIGSRLDIIQYGAGQVTLVGAGGVTVNTSSTLKTRALYSSITVVKMGTNEWVAMGDLALV